MASQGFFDYGDNFGYQISGESDEKDTAFLNKFIKRADEKFIKTYERKQEGGMENSDFETEKYKGMIGDGSLKVAPFNEERWFQ